MGLNIWEFLVKEGHEDDFIRMNEHDWPNLFKRSPHYLGTVAGQVVENSQEYLTYDRWTSESDFQAFVAENRDEFNALDLRHKEHLSSSKHICFWST